MKNSKIISDLAENLVAGNSILFSGAGVGVEAQLPNWEQSLSNLAEYVKAYDSNIASAMVDRIKKKYFLDAAELYYMADTTPDYRLKGLESIFGKKPVITSNIQTLMKLNLKSCTFKR